MILEALLATTICTNNTPCNKSVEAFNKQSGIERIEEDKKEYLSSKLTKTELFIGGLGIDAYRFTTNKEVTFKYKNRSLKFNKDNVQLEIKWNF